MTARVLTVPEPVPASRWTREDWDRFSEHAAPEAIAARLKAERGAARAAADRVSRLEVLLARRCREVADGEWPPRRQDGGS